MTIVVAVQSIHQKGVCPYPAHLFIDVLAKVGNVKNSTPIVQVCVHQIFSEAFERDRAICLWLMSMTSPIAENV